MGRHYERNLTNLSALTRREFLKVAGGFAFAAGATWTLGSRWSGAEGAVQRKPNIVLILADDLGYAELGCQGCKDIPTPNIDSIARNGVRFTQGYVTCPVCAPTEVLYWRFFEKRAIGMGDWKLVKEAGQTRWELYNLAEDISETRNLAEKMPKKVKGMEEAWEEWNAQLQPPKWVRQDARTAGRRRTSPLAGTGRGINIEQRFRRMDRNGDGKLSQDEVGRPALFRRLDINKDGFVTLDEAKKALGVG